MSEKKGEINKNKLGLIFLGIIGIIFFASLISATITIVSPINYGNFSGSSLVTFNVSYVNGTDYNDALNATFYYNLSGVWTYIGFTTDCNNAATIGSCNASLNISGLTDGRYSINATIGNVTTKGATVVTSNIIFDKLSPNVSTFYTSTNNGNYSGAINLNVSVSDAIMGVNFVYFNITNSSGVQINFTQASVSGVYYNVSIDTTTFVDGKYNVTVYANDSLNSVNKTERIQITFDNTVPSGSFSCSPSTIYSGDVISCACSPTDATSGVNSSATIYTSNPSTSNTGTYSISCSFTDLSGNSGSATASYTVELSSASASSSSTGTTSTFTYSKTIPTTGELNELQSIDTSSFSGGGLAVKERVTFKLNSEEHYLGIRELNSSSVKIEIASEPTQFVLNIGEENKIDLDNDNYYDLLVIVNGITNGKANLLISYIHEAVSVAQEPSTTSTGETPVNELPSESSKNFLGLPYWVWIIVGFVLLVIGGGIILKKKRK